MTRPPPPPPFDIAAVVLCRCRFSRFGPFSCVTMPLIVASVVSALPLSMIKHQHHLKACQCVALWNVCGREAGPDALRAPSHGRPTHCHIPMRCLLPRERKVPVVKIIAGAQQHWGRGFIGACLGSTSMDTEVAQATEVLPGGGGGQ